MGVHDPGELHLAGLRPAAPADGGLPLPRLGPKALPLPVDGALHGGAPGPPLPAAAEPQPALRLHVRWLLYAAGEATIPSSSSSPHPHLFVIVVTSSSPLRDHHHLILIISSSSSPHHHHPTITITSPHPLDPAAGLGRVHPLRRAQRRRELRALLRPHARAALPGAAPPSSSRLCGGCTAVLKISPIITLTPFGLMPAHAPPGRQLLRRHRRHEGFSSAFPRPLSSRL